MQTFLSVPPKDAPGALLEPTRVRAAPFKKTSATVSHSRKFFDNRFVYTVISQRARGLSIGVNMNPYKFCNFDCVYCEVDRREPPRDRHVNADVMSKELRQMLWLAHTDKIRELPGYQSIPADLLRLREVAFSGDGEPTLCPNFAELVEAVVHVRAQAGLPFFKLVLITNASGLHLDQVRRGLKLFTSQDEIWAKLDAGTNARLTLLNRPQTSVLSCPKVSLEQVMENILVLGQQRPVVIQSLFPSIGGKGPSPEDVEQYVQRLRELKEAGAQISLVQVYSAHRQAARGNCGHLSLKSLSDIARRVREVTGFKAEVF